ncbi:sigma-70 family RNA polymerase sigma factor [Roseiconus nitratireducens]|uniref:Sigma-70 family RNA polymerase sigma factor n=1 Tax=Roseiconus nitratireducens TaxID=2605748 RepID=A0A5M6DGG4_9BACT|nr:sigma-70 family RNA polymerase sigma factor [Roseiconus nitratireducens]KAA5545496.1 sigma-70 family RNA polymerase sigma factor [Roseiconus nitratireducens]
MKPDPPEVEASRLSQIQTHWSAIFESVSDDVGGPSKGHRDLLLRYAGPAYRYLLAVCRDPDIADDLAQEFAFKFVRGDFRRASPDRGRFRDYLKRSLTNLVNDHFRRQQTRPRTCAVELLQGREPSYSPPIDDTFDQEWRREVLSRTWLAMDAADANNGSCYSLVLKLRAQHPRLDSSQLATLTGERLNREVTAAWLRQTLKRARDRFGELMRTEVEKSLLSDSAEEVDRELRELGLKKYLSS